MVSEPVAERLSRARDPVVWVIVLAAAIAILGFMDLARDIGTPFGGYISYRRANIATSEVDANTPQWWAGVSGNRLQHSDVLVAVEGQPYYPDARRVFAAADADQQVFVRVEFIPYGQTETITRNIPIHRFNLSDYVDVRLPDFILALVFWLLAVVVYRSGPNNPVNRAFALLAALVAMIRALYVHSVFLDDAFSTVIEAILLTTIPMIGVGLVFFSSRFPSPLGQRSRLMLWPALAIGLVVAAFAVLARLPELPPAPFPNSAWFGRATYLGTQVLYISGLILLAVRLIAPLALRRPIGRRRRRTLIIVLAGFLAASPMLFGSAFNGLTVFGFRIGYFWSGLDLRYLFLAVPLAFAYVLVRYQAMRSPSRLFIVVIALAFSALVAALGVWVWTRFHPLWLHLGQRPPLLAFFLVALISSVVWGTQASWRGTFGGFLHRNQRNFGSAVAFGREIAGETNLNRLPDRIARSLAKKLELERAAVWLLAPVDNALHLEAQYGHFGVAPPEYLTVSHVPDTSSPIHVGATDVAPAWLQPLHQCGDLELAVPLFSGPTLIGLLGFGPRWDEEVFDERDMIVAELVGQQAALFLTAARNVDELRRVPARMAEAQERERSRLARELHDTVQQFLGRLPFYLAVGRDAIRTKPEVTEEILDNAVIDVEVAAATLRQIRYDLAPSQLERGLVQPIVALAGHFQDRSGVVTSVQAEPVVDGLTDLSTRHAVYRVVQQALDNVGTHADATAVLVNLQHEGAVIVFSVTDNGCGATDDEREGARLRGSFGLETMRARLEACGGEFIWHSIPGLGTTVLGRVPVAPPNGVDQAVDERDATGRQDTHLVEN